MNIKINKNKVIFQLLLLSFLLTSNFTQAHEVPKTSINAGLTIIQDNAFKSLLVGLERKLQQNHFYQPTD